MPLDVRPRSTPRIAQPPTPCRLLFTSLPAPPAPPQRFDCLQALTTTFSLLRTSRSYGEQASSGCSTAILLLTDGEITEGLGSENASEISTLVDTLNADIDAQIFTFALGPEADSVSESKRLAIRAPGD